jgi:hypothetical protein
MLQAADPAGASVHTVTIAADASIPCRMLHETLYTLGQARVTTANLLVRSGFVIPFTFDASPLADQVRRAHQALVPGAPTALQLQVIVTTRRTPGFVISAAGREMGPGRREAGEGGAVPKLGDVYNFTGLTACRMTIKSSERRFSKETHVTITADGSVNMQTLVSTSGADETDPRLLRRLREPLHRCLLRDSLGVERVDLPWSRVTPSLVPSTAG